jgi:hypothetical protein
MLTKLCSFSLATLAGVAVSHAAVVVDDDFNGATAVPSGYSAENSGTLAIVDDTLTNFATDSLQFNPSTTFEILERSFANQQVLLPGDMIEVSFDLNYSGTVPNSPSGFRFGIGDGSVGAAPGSAEGYTVSIGTGNSSDLSIFDNNAATTVTNIGGMSDNISGASTGTANLVGGEVASLGLTITRTATGLDFLATYSDDDGIATRTASVVGGDVNFSEIAFVTRNAAAFNLDNVNVTFTPIPEPTSGLAVIGGLGLLAARRRR